MNLLQKSRTAFAVETCKNKNRPNRILCIIKKKIAKTSWKVFTYVARCNLKQI